MKKTNLTYQKSGVNIKSADRFINYISSKVKNSKKGKNFKNIGGFGAVSEIPGKNSEILMVTSTDGVGTKLEIANETKNFKTIGIDLVAMCVNDLIVQGATPHSFLDYLSIGKINLTKMKEIMNGILKGCKIANCELVGGETAEMPGTYAKDKFDLAGFAIGFVNKKKILKKDFINIGNLILAVPSSGVHSNGYSLIREILKQKKINLNKKNFLKKELIKPTKIYVKEILELTNKELLNGCAHITGGGLKDNIKRIIPNGLTAYIDLKKIKTKKLFSWIKSNGVSDQEMLKTFNCGIGFCLIIDKKNLWHVTKQFESTFKPYIIGEIKKGDSPVIFNDKIFWK